jgi:hypothetical protein
MIDTQLLDQTSFKYGFDKHNEDLFLNREPELMEMCEIHPGVVRVQDRLECLKEIQLGKFDAEAYLADFFEKDLVDPKIKYDFKIAGKNVNECEDMNLK